VPQDLLPTKVVCGGDLRRIGASAAKLADRLAPAENITNITSRDALKYYFSSNLRRIPPLLEEDLVALHTFKKPISQYTLGQVSTIVKLVTGSAACFFLGEAIGRGDISGYVVDDV